MFIDGRVTDPHSIAEDVTSIWHWATGGLRVGESGQEDLGKLFDLIRHMNEPPRVS